MSCCVFAPAQTVQFFLAWTKPTHLCFQPSVPFLPSQKNHCGRRNDSHISFFSFVVVKVLPAPLTPAQKHKLSPQSRHGRMNSVILSFEVELKFSALFHAPQNEPWLNLNTFLNLRLITYYKTHYLHLTSAQRCGLWSSSGYLWLLDHRCGNFLIQNIYLKSKLRKNEIITFRRWVKTWQRVCGCELGGHTMTS